MRAVNGVLEASVNAVTGRVDVRYDPDRTGPRALIAAVQMDAGVDATLAPQDAEVDGALLREKEKRLWRRKFLISLAFSIPLFLINSKHYFYILSWMTMIICIKGFFCFIFFSVATTCHWHQLK